MNLAFTLVFVAIAVSGCNESFRSAPSESQLSSVTPETISGDGTTPPETTPPAQTNPQIPSNHDQVNNDQVDIVDFGADPTGKIDSSPAFKDAIAKVNPSGRVNIPCGKFRLSSSIKITSGLVLSGVNKNCVTLTPDEGITTIHITSNGNANGFVLQNFSIHQIHPNAKNVGIKVEATGPGAAVHWTMAHLDVYGSAVANIRTSGTGIELNAALMGHIHDCNIRYWKYGISELPVYFGTWGPFMPNANDIHSNEIAGNEIGIHIIADDGWIHNNTIEGNLTGIIASTVNGLSVYANHFEQAAIFGQIDSTGMISGPFKDIVVNGGPLQTFGNLMIYGIVFLSNAYWSPAGGDYITSVQWCSNQPTPTDIGAQYAIGGPANLSYGAGISRGSCSDYYQGYSWMTGAWSACANGVQSRMVYCVDGMGVGIDPWLNLCPGGMAARPQDSRTCN